MNKKGFLGCAIFETKKCKLLEKIFERQSLKSAQKEEEKIILSLVLRRFLKTRKC
jgi:hypothetical protein